MFGLRVGAQICAEYSESEIFRDKIYGKTLLVVGIIERGCPSVQIWCFQDGGCLHERVAVERGEYVSALLIRERSRGPWSAWLKPTRYERAAIEVEA